MEANLEKMEAMDLKGNLEEREYRLEHHEVNKVDAVRKLVKGRKKWHKCWKQVAGQHGEPKDLARGICGSRRKLAATCRKVSRHAAVAQCKGKVIRKLWTTAGIYHWQKDVPPCRGGTAQGKLLQKIFN